LTSFTGSALTFDAENRITSASQSGVGSMYYFYDGAGRRVQEVSTYNVEKVFVYDAFGQMAAEYSLGAQSPPCTTCYIATDHLGSTRLVTDQNANVVGRHDYLPFGEEIAANAGGRDGTFGTQDFVNQKFTGQERDVETGLDFFQARYFSAALGRFASPDAPILDQDPSNPQSWNLYTYVRNNPLSFVDPDGHTCVTATGEPVAPDYPDVKWDNNDGYGCQTVVNVYGGYIDPIRAALSLSNILQLPAQDSTQPDRTSPPKNGTKQSDGLDWTKIGSCLASSTANHYGLTEATGVSGLLALPIPKAIVPPYKVIGTPTTNILSILGRYVDISIPSITIAGRTSGNLLRVAGRANPYVFAGLLAIDAGVIGYNTYNCYQQSGQPGGQQTTNGSGGPQ
jgi:RHS repeat-associated protein